LGIAFKAANVFGQFMQYLLAVMAKWRIPDVMCQGACLCHNGIIHSQVGSDAARDLGHLQAVCQAVTIEAIGIDPKQLHFSLKAAKGR
jgi:hypothetical protein